MTPTKPRLVRIERTEVAHETNSVAGVEYRQSRRGVVGGIDHDRATAPVVPRRTFGMHAGHAPERAGRPPGGFGIGDEGHIHRGATAVGDHRGKRRMVQSVQRATRDRGAGARRRKADKHDAGYPAHADRDDPRRGYRDQERPCGRGPGPKAGGDAREHGGEDQTGPDAAESHTITRLAQIGETLLADAAHFPQLIHRAESAASFALGDDRPRERRPDARQRLELRTRGVVEIDHRRGA